MILASFHGIPKEYVDKGDPYHCHCAETTRLLRERLGLDESSLMLTFQSRFGRGGMAHALYRQDREGAGQARREESRRHHAGLFRRLPGDAGRNRDRERRNLQAAMAARIFAAIPCLNDSPAAWRRSTHGWQELTGWV